MKKGFTLIELLVVVAIMGILAAVGITTFTSAMQKSRDARRKTDLRAIQSMMEMYYQDNGIYPPIPGCWAMSSGGGDWITGLAPKYMKQIPVDPRNSGGCYPQGADTCFTYGVCSQWGTGYLLIARLEYASDPEWATTRSRDDIGNVWGPSAGLYVLGKM